jgi:MFS family permease
MGGFLFLNTLYLQNVRGLSPLDAGLYLLPMAGMLLVFSPLSGRLVGRSGARLPLVLGALAMIVGGLMLTSITPTTPTGYLLGAYVVFGLAMGLMNPPITNTAVSGMPGEQAGVAAAVASTSRQVGFTLGVAVIGSITGGAISGTIGKSFAAATHPSWWIVVGLGVLILALGLLTTGAWAKQTARRAAEAFPDRAASAAYPARTPSPAGS